MAFGMQVFITLSLLFAFLTKCYARNTITIPSENDAIGIGNHETPRANSGHKPGHPAVDLRNDVVSIEDYGPTGPDPKHQPPLHPPLVNAEDYGPTRPDPKHQPPRHPPLVNMEDYGPTGPNPKHEPTRQPPLVSTGDYRPPGPN